MTPLFVTAAHVETARVWRRRALFFAIVALCSWDGAAQGLQEPDRQKTVLAFYSTRRGTPSAVVLDSALERTLGTGLAGRLDFHVEYIDLARFTEPGYQLSLRDFLRAKYAQYKFDLVIATSDDDLDFATRYRDDLFPGVPLVFSSSPGSSPVPNATGVVSELNLRDTVRIATTIQPDVRRVVVVSGASAIDKSYETFARDQFKVFEGRLVFTYLSGLPLSELLRQVAQLPADSIIYYLAVFEDGNGDKFVGVDGLEKIAAVANVPIYTWHISGLDRGTVGGSLISMEVLARRLAELALRVLGGERADAIAITEFNPNVVEFDWRQLQRWQIDERRLPSGSVVRFRQPTTWERYKAYIITAVAVLGLQTMFIAGLLFQRARRRRVEAALRQNQQRYALATVAGAVGVWDWNLNTNGMYVDPQLKQLLGYRDDEIRNHLDDWRQRVHPDDREVVRTRAQACIDDGLDAYELEHRMLHKNGSLRWFVARGSIMKRADGTPYRIVGTDNGHHRAQARRTRDSRERSRPSSQQRGDSESCGAAHRGAGSGTHAHRTRPARRREPAAGRYLDRPQQSQAAHRAAD